MTSNRAISERIIAGCALTLVVSLAAGCHDQPAVSGSPEKTPWLFPEKQLELLESSDYRTRALAARNLGNMGARAADAVPALERLREDDHPKVRQAAEKALARIRADDG